jgi:hypothetical protein
MQGKGAQVPEVGAEMQPAVQQPAFWLHSFPMTMTIHALDIEKSARRLFWPSKRTASLSIWAPSGTDWSPPRISLD